MKTNLLILLIGAIILGWGGMIYGQQTGNQYSIWVGSHYTGLSDYYAKVAEFDRGVEGIVPEIGLKFRHLSDRNSLMLNGYYYDPKRMMLDLDARRSDWLNFGVRYQSFYRQDQRDLLENAVVREALNREGTTPGGKMITHSELNPAQDLGWRRQQIQSNLEVKIPGLNQVKFIASHQSILEDGHTQHIQVMHCSTCHLQSRAIELKQQSHTVSGGVELDLGSLLVSYQASFRSFKSDAGPYETLFDTARHPVNGGSGAEFGARELYNGTVETIAQMPEIEKVSHNLKVNADIGKGKFLSQFVIFNARNKAPANTDNVTVLNDREYSGKHAYAKFIYPLWPKTKVVASASVGEYENNPVIIDLPPWREGRPGGGQDFDWTRYSNLTRTEASGSVEFIYQPARKYRLSLLGGYFKKNRLDYPAFSANDVTRTWRGQIDVRYRPTQKFSGQLRYTYDKTSNPFAPHNHMFEKSGSTTLTPLPGNPFVYYFQRDELRYGDITSLPTDAHNIRFELNFKPTQALNLKAGANILMATNSDEPRLDFKRTSYQPHFSLTYLAGDRWDFFSSYSYLYQTQNGLASVAMMDG